MDISAQLTLVFNVTKNRIVYIGHSMGGTVGFMYASEYPKEAHRILHGIIGVAPVIYIGNTPIIQFMKPLSRGYIVSQAFLGPQTQIKLGNSESFRSDWLQRHVLPRRFSSSIFL